MTDSLEASMLGGKVAAQLYPTIALMFYAAYPVINFVCSLALGFLFPEEGHAQTMMMFHDCKADPSGLAQSAILHYDNVHHTYM